MPSLLNIITITLTLTDIYTAEEIRNKENTWKNADDILGGGGRLDELDTVMRSVFDICRRRGIKLSPSKLQLGRRICWGGVIVEAVGPLEEESNVLISPDEKKVEDFLNFVTPSSKKE